MKNTSHVSDLCQPKRFFLKTTNLPEVILVTIALSVSYLHLKNHENFFKMKHKILLWGVFVLEPAETDEQKGYINWLSTVKFILKYCHLERVWLNPNAISTGKLARQCKKVLQDKFIKFFKHKLSNSILSNVTCNIIIKH